MMATHPDVGSKEGEVMPPPSGWVGERGLPALGERLLGEGEGERERERGWVGERGLVALGERLLGNELIDVLRRRVVLYKLARVGRVGEGEGGRIVACLILF